MNKKLLFTAAAVSFSALAAPALPAQAASPYQNCRQAETRQITIISNGNPSGSANCRNGGYQAALEELRKCFPSLGITGSEGAAPQAAAQKPAEQRTAQQPRTAQPETRQPVTSQPAAQQPCETQPAARQPEQKPAGQPAQKAPEEPAVQKPADSQAAAETARNQETAQDYSRLSYAGKVVYLVNEERAKYGLSPLTMAEDVRAAAQVRAAEIQASFSHTRPDGRHFVTALAEQDVSYRGAGENIAWGQRSPEAVMEAWMNSPGHRANILNEKFTTIGVGYLQNTGGVDYWSQLFTY